MFLWYTAELAYQWNASVYKDRRYYALRAIEELLQKNSMDRTSLLAAGLVSFLMGLPKG